MGEHAADTPGNHMSGLKSDYPALELDRIRLVYADSPLPTFIIDSDGRVLDLNKSMEELIEYTREDIENDPYLLSWIPKLITDHDECRRTLNIAEKALAGMIDIKRDEFILTRKNGDKRYVEFSVYTIRQKDISPGMIIVQGFDITDTKHTEEGLRLLSSAIEQSSEGVALYDLEGNLIFVNKSFASMHGFTTDELIEKHISIFHTPEQLPVIEQSMKFLHRRGEFRGEIWHVQRDGTVFPTLTHTTLLRDNSWNPIGYITTCQNITETKRLENQRNALRKIRSEMQNMESVDDIEKLLKVISENLPAGNIAYSNAEINVIKNPEEPFHVKSYNLSDEQKWTDTSENRSIHNLVQFWESGVPVYRGDLLNEDPYGEREIIWSSWGRVRSVIDIPFSHGTLALNSVFPNAFSREDIRFLKELSQILSEGFRRAEDLQQLALSEARYRTLVETLVDQVVFLTDREGTCLYMSPQIETLTGYTPDEFRANAIMLDQIISEKDLKRWKRAFKKTTENGTAIKLELQIRQRSDPLVWVEGIIVPIFNNDEVEAVQIVFHNITEQKRVEKALRKSEEQLQNLYDYSPDIYFTVSSKGIIISINRFGADYLGYRKRQILGKPLWGIVHEDDVDTIKRCIDDIFKKRLKKTEMECRVIRKDGSIIWVHKRTNLILDDTNDPKELRITCSDVSDRKQAREQLSKSLEEKEILLKEIHHRVKNNMQVISSLLSLQVDRIDDPHYITMFKESINRIQTMALIHELLYRSENFSQIDFHEYITRISVYLSNLYSAKSGYVDFRINVKDIHLKLDIAIPCGLVINELISNSYKYAFEDSKGGRIAISMKKKNESLIELIVADNGFGIPEDFDWRNAETLGLKMVKLLVESQLGGSVELLKRTGAAFRIRFNS